MSQQGVHYFPGHMSKALRNISNFVKVVDLIVEIVDARAPYSCRNPLLAEIAPQKARVLLLSKSDMADDGVTKQWIKYFADNGVRAVAGNLKKERFVTILNQAAAPFINAKREKEKRIGMKKQAIRVMVIGIPNVGKSTLINNLRGRKVAQVGNKAGVTRAEQWIKLNDDFTLLDTPGILPMNYPNGQEAIRLALLGSMKEEVLPTEELCYALIGYLKENYPQSLQNRFGIDDISNYDSQILLQEIARKRGLLEGANPSETKAAYLLIKEFKDGLLGNISLEIPDAQ
ncbi:MAG: ribosome biogenesis GTPase YlqF [Bacilli bacterium]|nr:ribosome biogenesis GTPase YlqF [Bacilli bacterium]